MKPVPQMFRRSA